MNTVYTMYISNSFVETKRIGGKIAEDAKEVYGKNQRVIIGLIGDLGAGKTSLTKGIAESLKVKDEVTSPSFLLVKEYKEGEIPLYHFDFYRLNTEEDLHSFGFLDYFNQEGYFVIEWADKFVQVLPSDTLLVTIDIIEDNKRRITAAGK